MLFHKWRIRKLSAKMNHCVKVISEIDEWLEFSDDAVLEEIESLRFSRVKAQAELERLTWKYIELKQKYPHKIPPFDARKINSLEETSELLKKIREAAKNLETAGEADARYHSTPNIDPCDAIPPATESVHIVDVSGPEKYIDHWKVNVAKRLTAIEEIVFAKTESYVEEAPDRTTVKDLEALMKDKMVEEDPGLQGDLAMLLHKLRDPANHPVSLLAMAYQVAKRQCPDPKLVASALEMLVDEYRNRIGPTSNFEMSDKACLEAMDVERGTTVC